MRCQTKAGTERERYFKAKDCRHIGSISLLDVVTVFVCVFATVIPIVTVIEDTVYQAVGYRIELQCFAEGNPTPQASEAYWTREGVPLPSASDESVAV